MEGGECVEWGISDCMKPQEDKIIYNFLLTPFSLLHSFPPSLLFPLPHPTLT